MKVLYTAFNGKQNASKILLDKIDTDHKLYLKNSNNTSVEQLKKELANDYDLVVSIGSARLRVNTFKIETVANGDVKYTTTYDYTNIKESLEDSGYKVIISKFAGRYLCNNLYYHILKYINDNNLKTKMIFIHIPRISNIRKLDKLVDILVKDI